MGPATPGLGRIMDNQFGYPPRQWSEAKREARGALVVVAKQETTIAYSDLVTEIHAISLEAHDIRLDTCSVRFLRMKTPPAAGCFRCSLFIRKATSGLAMGFLSWQRSLGTRSATVTSSGSRC